MLKNKVRVKRQIKASFSLVNYFQYSIPNPIVGNPDAQHISTSFVERQNLTMRMQLRRFTRLTNAFSKKYANLKSALALYFAHYNFVRIHGTLKTTPAMAAGISNQVLGLEDLIL